MKASKASKDAVFLKICMFARYIHLNAELLWGGTRFVLWFIRGDEMPLREQRSAGSRGSPLRSGG